MPATGKALAGLTATFPARPEGLEELHAAFERFFAACDAVDASIRSTDRVAFLSATAEIAANIVEHACGDLPDATVSMVLNRDGDAVEARFEDPGIACVPIAPDPDDPIPHLGLGIAVARASVDALEYGRIDGINRWRLMRRTEVT